MILIFQRVLANYRLPIFKKLNEEIGVVLCLGKTGPKNTFLFKTKPDFDHIKIKDFYPIATKEMLVIQDVFTPIFKYKPEIVIIEFALSIISNWFFLFLKPFFKYKIILWSHGYNRKRGFNPKISLSDKLRRYWMNKADAIILYSYNSKKLIEPFVLKREKIFVAPNTLDTKRLVRIRDDLEKSGKGTIRREINFKKKYNLIYLGRLLKEKEPDRLLDVFKIVSRKLKSIELHFVGDGPLYSKLLEKSVGLNVRFWVSVSDDIFLGKLLFSSDLMVLPGYMGLSVVHSFCFDCPVATQIQGKQGPFHSPEIEYLINGKTGFLVEYGNNDKMAGVVSNYLLSSENVKDKFKNNIRKMIEDKCSIENMIDGFKKAIDFCQKAKN
ncbi:MAG: glycosyltransferase [Candidatus Atribacteria bacterium]|nr:MAG: glycosyltransferase [Candidatus Atribacteria bacterium]